MNAKKFLLGSIMIGGLLAALRLLFARTAPTEPGFSNASKAAIDDYIEEQMRRLCIPGAALAIVDNGQIVHMRGLGHARPGSAAPTPQTPFFIGSLTKSFTAVAAMQLVEAGKANLDAPVQQYLPWFRVAPPRTRRGVAPVVPPITVRHLLNQTSGLPMAAGMKTLANTENQPDATESLARALSTVVPNHPAGEVCEYCNLNYDLLGLVIEAASGESYAEYIQKHIFDPLGMVHSYTSKAAARQDGLAVGYRYWFGIPIPAPDLPVPQAAIASGQLISCAEDMARYLIAHLNSGCFGDNQILSPSGMEVLHQGAADYAMMGISAGRYAMGWFEDKIGQTPMLSHGGNVPEYSAYMGLLPDQRKGIVLLINADHYGLPPVLGEVGWGATALLADQLPAPTKLDFIPWAMRLLALIPILQVACAVRIMRSVHRWKRDPLLRGHRQRRRTPILIPLIANLSIASIPVLMKARGILGYLRLFMPDVYWTTLISGGLAGLWAVLRTALVLHARKKLAYP